MNISTGDGDGTGAIPIEYLVIGGVSLIALGIIIFLLAEPERKRRKR